jgi:hypothetical protein
VGGYRLSLLKKGCPVVVMDDLRRNTLRIMLGDLLEHMEDAEELATRIAREYLEYRAMAEAVHSATDVVLMACEVEAYGERRSGD